MIDPTDRRERRIEGMILLALAVATLIVFAVTPLDLWASRQFYEPDADNPWQAAERLPWSVLYGLAPPITAFLILTGLGVLLVGAARGRSRVRRQGVFLLLSVIIGPGLIVNFIFKDHWGRPRPREIVEFASTSTYVAPHIPCDQGGASFPCGHCSVGFLLGTGWWIWRRRRPTWARASLAAGIVVGFALGLGRMAAGGHFLSDVVWSGLLALGIAHVLHEYVLRLPLLSEDAGPGVPGGRRAAVQRILAVLAAIGGILVLTAVFVTPHGNPIEERIPLASGGPPTTFELTARRASVDLVLIDEAPAIAIDGEMHGFGVPGSTLATRVAGDDATVRFEIVQEGLFTDLDASARVELPVAGLERVSVQVGRGNIKVTDRTREGIEATGLPVLDLQTGYGRILPTRRPASSDPDRAGS